MAWIERALAVLRVEPREGGVPQCAEGENAMGQRPVDHWKRGAWRGASWGAIQTGLFGGLERRCV